MMGFCCLTLPHFIIIIYYKRMQHPRIPCMSSIDKTWCDFLCTLINVGAHVNVDNNHNTLYNNDDTKRKITPGNAASSFLAHHHVVVSCSLRCHFSSLHFTSLFPSLIYGMYYIYYTYGCRFMFTFCILHAAYIYIVSIILNTSKAYSTI